MRNIKKFAAIMLLAVTASLSAPAASASGIILTERNSGILITNGVADGRGGDDALTNQASIIAGFLYHGIILIF